MKEMINFIEANVDGKTLFTKELVYELENGALQGVYSDQISFSNLKYSQSGFQIDMFIVSNEKIWLIGKEGQREKLRKDFSAVSMFRYELAKRKSANAITGCFRFISASGKNVAAEAIVSGIYDIRLENGVLKLSEDQALYRDQPIQDGVTSLLLFNRNIVFIARTENCTMNTMAGVLTWTLKLCSAATAPIPFLHLFQSRSKPINIQFISSNLIRISWYRAELSKWSLKRKTNTIERIAMETFDALIKKDDADRRTIIEVPFNAKEQFCKFKGPIYVSGTINGVAYRSKLLSRGGGK